MSRCPNTGGSLARTTAPTGAPLWWALVADHAGHPTEYRGLRPVVTNSVVWRLTVVYFLIQVGFYGLNTWLPTVVKTVENVELTTAPTIKQTTQ